MKIKFVEIQNFRKLKSIRIELADQTTLFVGANNSGKTSAMEALIRFLDKKKFTVNDFTLSNWLEIDKIGANWETRSSEKNPQPPSIEEWEKFLPSMDVWLDIAENEIQYIIHMLPTLDWKGGLLGIRLRFEPKKVDALYKEYVSAKKAVTETMLGAKKTEDNGKEALQLWPKSMVQFLDKKLNEFFIVRSYALDCAKLDKPQKGGVVQIQPLSSKIEPFDSDPLKGLIRVDDINAQRGLSDVDSESSFDSESAQRAGRKLSSQLRNYYTKHLDPSDSPDVSDIDALEAISAAQTSFDVKLRDAFQESLTELEGLGYPGVTDPKLTISTKIQPMDGLIHSSAVQFQVMDQDGDMVEAPLRLPEQYNGLGYQNLISMVFKLMSFRDGWMRVGKAGKKISTEEESSFPPLHLVLVEEPEAHLHAQVQQVFIRKAYQVLRNHNDLKKNPNLVTQLVVSTHSSHIAHECEFSWLRYFRRLPAQKKQIEVPTATVVNLSEVFGKKEETQRFVTRYLKATHCDLFFADAAILVEGPAERMLVPYFIRKYKDFEELNQSYITVLEIGGSHAHKLRQLIDHLGLVTLVITDLDATEPTNGEGKPVARGKNLITGNHTLKTWHPEKQSVDDLLDLKDDQKVKKGDEFYSVCVAYQCPVQICFNGDGRPEEAISNTFEDALIFENITMFRELKGPGLIGKFNKAINEVKSCAELEVKMFEHLKKGDKAAFALEMLDLKDPSKLTIPQYIREGLSWLQGQVKIRRQEIFVSEKAEASENKKSQ